MDAHELLVAPVAYMAPAKVLQGLAAEQAGARAPGAPHSVAEIVAHMIFWQSWFLERCAGVDAPPPASASLGWPAVSADRWDSLREQFTTDLDRALQLAADPGVCARPIDPAIEFPPLANYTIGDAITHIAVHNAHHLGQIVTLRQIQGNWPPPDGSYTW